MSTERYLSAPPAVTGVNPVYQLSLAEADVLRAVAQRFKVDPNAASSWYCELARRAARDFPSQLRHWFRGFVRDGSETGYALVKGIDVGRVPPTPRDNTGGAGRLTMPATLATCFAEMAGGAVAYEAEPPGALHQDLVAADQRRHPGASYFARESLDSQAEECEGHTEQCFTKPELTPAFVLEACLRGDPAASIHTLTARQLLRHLKSEEVQLAQERRWIAPIGEPYQRYVSNRWEMRDVSILEDVEGGNPKLRFDPNLRSTTPQAEDLRLKVRTIYREHRNSLVLQPGQLVALDNLHAMHGRSAYRAQNDGGDRFVVRMLAMTHLKESRYARTDPHRDRLIFAQFS